MGATPKSKRDRYQEIAKETGKCGRCPPHGGENSRKKPKSDKHKSKRKGK